MPRRYLYPKQCASIIFSYVGIQFLFGGQTVAAHGILVSQPVFEPGPQRWKRCILTSRHQGMPQALFFFKLTNLF